MSERPFIFDFADFLDFLFKERAYPPLYLDVLSADNPSAALIQTSSPVVEKEYVNGNRTYRAEVELLYQDVMENQLAARERMTDLAMFFTDVKPFDLSDSKKVLKVQCTAPSIREITEGNVFKMGVSLVIIYKE